MDSTSKIKALQYQIDSGAIKCDKARVLNLIQNNKGITLVEMADRLGKPNSTISARLQTLVDLGVVENKGTTKVVNGTTYTKWFYQSDTLKQGTNRMELTRKKLVKWAKGGIEKYKEFLNPETIAYLQTFSA